MDRNFQDILDYYLNSPISKTSEKLSFPTLENFVTPDCQSDETDPSFISSYFSSKDDLTSCSPSDKIYADVFPRLHKIMTSHPLPLCFRIE